MKLTKHFVLGLFMSTFLAFASSSYAEEPYPHADVNEDVANNNFDFLDANDDGFLEESEVTDDDYVASNFDDWDADDDGYLDASETDEDWLDWDDDSFDAYDMNDDGYLDSDEATGSDFLESNFDSWDINEDGYLDSDEASEGIWSDDEGYFQ